MDEKLEEFKQRLSGKQISVSHLHRETTLNSSERVGVAYVILH